MKERIMNNIYLISSGEYSDYGVCFLVESTEVISKDKFRAYWLEAVQRKDEYMDRTLEAIAKYLGVAKKSSMSEYRSLVDADSFRKAMEKVGYSYKEKIDFFEEILAEVGFSILSFDEYNTDDLGSKAKYDNDGTREVKAVCPKCGSNLLARYRV